MRVLILGGRGFLGSAIASAIRRFLGWDVVIGTRQPPGEGEMLVNLLRASAVESLSSFDAVVNCTGCTAAELVRDCIESRVLLLDMSSDAKAIESRLEDFHAKQTSGRVVLGMGIFPGLSNLLAAHLSQTLKEPPSRLEIAIRVSPFAGAGTGMIGQMMASLIEKAARYEDGERVEGAPMTRAMTIAFPSGPYPTLHIAFPEAFMLRLSTGVKNTATYYAPKPDVMRHAVRALAALLNGRLGRQLFRPVRWSLKLLRGLLLRPIPARVEMTAIANRRGSQPSPYATLIAKDGIACAAAALVSALQLLSKSRGDFGVRTPDEVLTLEAILATAHSLTGGPIAEVKIHDLS